MYVCVRCVCVWCVYILCVFVWCVYVVCLFVCDLCVCVGLCVCGLWFFFVILCLNVRLNDLVRVTKYV